MKLLKLGVVSALIFTVVIITGHLYFMPDSSYEPDDELVVIVHGLGRSDVSMWPLALSLKKEGYKICAIDYSTINQSIEAMKTETYQQIDSCIANAKKVNFVGHSLGGLVIRSYLAEHPILKQQRLGKVVLMGTPNHGSEVADKLKNNVIMKIAGGVTKSLVTDGETFSNQLPSPDYSIGIIAGDSSSIVTDNLFNKPNDGLVSVDSTKIEGMNDFIVMNVGHAAMRMNKKVAEQVRHYLKKGQFN